MMLVEHAYFVYQVAGFTNGLLALSLKHLITQEAEGEADDEMKMLSS